MSHLCILLSASKSIAAKEVLLLLMLLLVLLILFLTGAPWAASRAIHSEDPPIYLCLCIEVNCCERGAVVADAAAAVTPNGVCLGGVMDHPLG